MDTESIHVIYLDDSALDHRALLRALKEEPVSGRFVVEPYTDVPSFRSRMEKGPLPDLLLLDCELNDPFDNGVSLAKEFRGNFPNLIIILRSVLEDAKTITAALAAGADDFISKNSESSHLSLRLYQAVQLANLKRGSLKEGDLCKGQWVQSSLNVIGETMNRVKGRIPLLLSSAVSAIYVEGESGTGKEVVADLIESSLAPNTPFVRVNCAAIAPSLMESELFGYVKGAFTGATQDKAGLFESAAGGWIFLDELSMLTPSAQAALLRTLESRQIRRVGETKSRAVDFRLLSASNEPIQDLVRSKKFRADLWQRIRETEIKLPPLRQRPKEIEEFVRHFCRVLAGGPYEISHPALGVLSQCSWRNGNIRELRNTVKAMTEFRMNRLLAPISIPAEVWTEVQNGFEEYLGENCETSSSNNTPPSTCLLSIPFNMDKPAPFDELCDLLFMEIFRRYQRLEGKTQKTSLRLLAKQLQIARSTLAKMMIRLRVKDEGEGTFSG